MAILGLLLLAAAVVAGVEFGVSNTADTSFEVFGYGLSGPVASVFVLGALTMAVATLGTFLITGAFQRRRTVATTAKHRATEQRLGEYDATNAELVEENDRLRAELAEERRAAATMGGVAVPPGAGDVPYGDQVTDATRSQTISDTGRFEPYPTRDDRPQTIDNTKFDDDRVRTGARRYDGNGDGDVTGEEKAGILGRFRHDNR